jgi:hypothetical protein
VNWIIFVIWLSLPFMMRSSHSHLFMHTIQRIGLCMSRLYLYKHTSSIAHSLRQSNCVCRLMIALLSVSLNCELAITSVHIVTALQWVDARHPNLQKARFGFLIPVRGSHVLDVCGQHDWLPHNLAIFLGVHQAVHQKCGAADPDMQQATCVQCSSMFATMQQNMHRLEGVMISMISKSRDSHVCRRPHKFRLL